MNYKRYIIIFIFLFTAAAPVFAQQQSLDALRQNGFSPRSDINPNTSLGAQNRYNTAENMFLSGHSALTDSLLESEGFAGLFNTLFQIIVTLGAIWAVIELTYYGAKYALIDSFTGKKDAIKNIWPVAYGLAALLATYILFKQINPNLLKFGISDVKLQHSYKQASNPQDPHLPARVNNKYIEAERKREEEKKKKEQAISQKLKQIGVEYEKYKKIIHEIGKKDGVSKSKYKNSRAQSRYTKACQKQNNDKGDCTRKYYTVRACLYQNTSCGKLKREDFKYLDDALSDMYKTTNQ